jgi:hypothetical protein
LLISITFAACNVYDAQLVNQPITLDPTESEPADASVPVDAATLAACVVVSPTEHGSQEGGVDVGCTLKCPETCNNRDDDCDGKIDENAYSICELAHAEAVCTDGQCVVARCLDKFRDCDQRLDNGCEIAANDPKNCGACGRACAVEHGVATCVNEVCKVAVCDEGYDDCDHNGVSCETDLWTLSSCGACGKPCATECFNGTCLMDCSTAESGYEDCDLDGKTCETDLATNVAHCGNCQTACVFTNDSPHATAVCAAGSCGLRCSDGYGDCDANYENGCETKLTDDAEHCGACSTKCTAEHATPVCVAGRCERGACQANFAHCEGDGVSCEQSLLDAGNCGACGKKCVFPHARSGCALAGDAAQCVLQGCETGWEDCDGDLAANGCEREVAVSGTCLPDADCVVVPFENRTFYVCPTPRAWAPARMLCEKQLRGRLAEIRRQEVADALRGFVAMRAWVGHNDLNREGLWVWSSSKVPFLRDGKVLADRFSKWEPGEPNGSGDCGNLSNQGLLDDLDCGNPMPFICEVIPDLCPEDANKIDPQQCGCGQADTDIAPRDDVADCPGVK